jgi:glutamate synthase domain-containing protein 2
MGSPEPLENFLREVAGADTKFAPDFITIDSGDGGTGAAPMPLMDLVGLSIKESLPIASDLLHKYALRERIRLIASGKLMVPGEVAWAVAAGADFVTSARGFMFALGCIQALKCNKNTCPTGITTHNPRFQKGLVPADKSERVALYAKNIIHEVEVIAHSVGVKEPRQILRKHVRLVQDNGRSQSMLDLYPRPETNAAI